MRHDRTKSVVRSAIPYAVLLAVFASASISDARPGLTSYAIMGAAASIFAALVAIFFLSSSGRDGTASNVVSKVGERESPIARAEVVVSDRELAIATLEYAVALRPSSDPNFAVRLMKSRLDSRHKALAHARRNNIALYEYLVGVEEGISRGSVAIPEELAKWRYTSRGERAFSVTAGAFEIDHFHGHTNIRVLDPSTVTVQGLTEDEDGRVHPAQLRTPMWN